MESYRVPNIGSGNLLLNSSMNSKAPESIKEAILIIYGGNFEFKITVPITVNESSIIVRQFTPFSKSIILLWNANTLAMRSSLMKPSAFLKMIDLKFSKNNLPIDIDLLWAILWINYFNYGIIFSLFLSLKSISICSSCSSYKFKEKCLKQKSGAGINKEPVKSSYK